MLMIRVAEFQMLGTWFLAIWQRLVLLLGWDRPPGEPSGLVAGQRAERFAPPRDLGFDTVLPDLIGRVFLPAGPGRSRIVSLKQVTVGELLGGFQSLAEASAQWPFAAELGTFAAYVVLEGPGWELTVVFGGAAAGKAEYYGRKAGGTPVSGVAGWEALVQALMLSPDYEAVVGFLALGPYWTPFYAV